MTLLTLLSLTILFLAFFIYFSGINPQEITVFFYNDHSITTSAAILVIGCIAVGLFLGVMANIYQTLTHQLTHWKSNRREKKSREVTSTYREGVARLLSGDIKKAHTLLQKALDRDSSRLEIYLAMANVHIQEGDHQQAINLLLKAKDLEPKSLEVLFKLAATHEEMNQIEEASQVYGEILAIEAGNRKALRGLRELNIRQGLWKEALDLQKRVIKAAQGSQRLAEEQKKQLYLRYEVARQALADNGSEQSKAEIKELSEIVRLAPEFVPARVTLGEAYRAQKRHEDAARVWQEGYKTLGKSVFLSRLEDLYISTEDPSTLLAIYRSFLQERGSDLMFRLFYGKLCLRLEMVDEALEQLYAVENAGVESPQLHLLLAEAHRRRNRPDEAIIEYKKALGIDNRLRLGYVCETCAETAEEWQSRCPACGIWGSYVLEGRQMIKEANPVEIREIRHGERQA